MRSERQVQNIKSNVLLGYFQVYFCVCLQSFSNQLDNMKSVLLSVALVIVAFGKTGKYVGVCVREKEIEISRSLLNFAVSRAS